MKLDKSNIGCTCRNLTAITTSRKYTLRLMFVCITCMRMSIMSKITLIVKRAKTSEEYVKRVLCKISLSYNASWKRQNNYRNLMKMQEIY